MNDFAVEGNISQVFGYATNLEVHATDPDISEIGDIAGGDDKYYFLRLLNTLKVNF